PAPGGVARDPELRAAQSAEGVRRALERPVLREVPVAVNDALLLNKVATWDELGGRLRAALATHYPAGELAAQAERGVGHVRTVGVELRRAAAVKVPENDVKGPATTRLEGLDINRFTTVQSAIQHVAEKFYE